MDTMKGTNECLVPISTRVTDRMRQKINLVCESRGGCTQTDVVRDALEEYMTNHGVVDA